MLPFTFRCILVLGHLFSEVFVGRKKSIPLAVDGRGCAPADGVHFPVGVVIIHHVKVAVSAPWHPLHQPFAEMVESNGDLHVFVLRVIVAVSQEHDFVVISEVVVGYGDGRGSGDGIDEAVMAFGQ